MDVIGIWLSPLLLLPGVGLLIMSTSQRFNRLHDEIHHIMEEGSSKSAGTVNHLMQRAKYFRNALVFLYSSISIFSVAGISSGITSGRDEISTVLTISLTIIGIICITTIESHTRELNEKQ